MMSSQPIDAVVALCEHMDSILSHRKLSEKKKMKLLMGMQGNLNVLVDQLRAAIHTEMKARLSRTDDLAQRFAHMFQPVKVHPAQNSRMVSDNPSFPETGPIKQSDNNKHVFYVPHEMKVQGQTCQQGWYYWDEVGLLGGGPYATETLAIELLKDYAESLNNGSEEVPATEGASGNTEAPEGPSAGSADGAEEAALERVRSDKHKKRKEKAKGTKKKKR